MRNPLPLLPLAASAPAALVRAGWIDEDTPQRLRTTRSLVDGGEYHLVMSDEFNVPNRTFADGHDPAWTALDKSDDDYSASGGGSLHFYNSSMVTTTPDGMLTIRTIIDETEWSRYDTVEREWKQETKHFKSGMLQGWNKFCFTGGILELDVVLPGSPDIGGLWPAAWVLGNLGRATYEASTNNIWPWSYDVCDRKKQQSQAMSACDEANHFGLNRGQGRGATEIDVLELMGGDSDGPLPATFPPISLPYVDMTLQVAPGIPDHRPQSGSQPVRTIGVTDSGFATSVAEKWYDNLTVAGNTSLNPFFYGTYLGETKPGEPVTRSKAQAFQADAVGAMKQVVPEHFKTPHTFRVEWQPGRGGRLDWFTKSYKRVDENGTVYHVEGDGKGQDWEHSLHIPDFALDDAMGSKIPEEPSYIILNTAISSTWAFPYSVPDWCPKCYDCDNPKCQCSFNPGFCNMMKTGKVALKIDSVRVYQSRDHGAHPGGPHTVGCDPVEFPTREFIRGYEYRYMRNPPFVYEDRGPLKKVRSGGGSCVVDDDCGGGGAEDEDVDEDWETPEAEEGDDDAVDLDDGEDGGTVRENQSPLAHTEEKKAAEIRPNKRRLDEAGEDDAEGAGDETDDGGGGDGGGGDNPTAGLQKPPVSEESLEDNETSTKVLSNPGRKPKGQCVVASTGLFGGGRRRQCRCNEGYTGPRCLSVDKFDEEPGAYELKRMRVMALFEVRVAPHLTRPQLFLVGALVGAFAVVVLRDVRGRGRRRPAMRMRGY